MVLSGVFIIVIMVSSGIALPVMVIKKNNPQTQHIDAMSEGYLIRIRIGAYSHEQASLFTLLSLFMD